MMRTAPEGLQAMAWTLISNAECGVRNAECKWKGEPRIDAPLKFRIPHSAFSCYDSSHELSNSPFRASRRHRADHHQPPQIGRASCRERVSISVGAGSF